MSAESSPESHQHGTASKTTDQFRENPVAETGPIVRLLHLCPLSDLFGMFGLRDPLLQRSDPRIFTRRVLPRCIRRHPAILSVRALNPTSGGMALAAAPVKARPV